MQFLTSILCSNPTCISLLLFTAAQGENVIPPLVVCRQRATVRFVGSG